MVLSETELQRWGDLSGRQLAGPAFLGLRGPLGAGKSVLARAIAGGAGVKGAMPSPTFNVLFRYESDDGRRVAHLDLYRLADADEVWELGWEELGTEGEIAMVEWPERAEAHLPPDRWDIHLNHVPDRPDHREVSVARVGNPSELPSFPLMLEVRPGV